MDWLGNVAFKDRKIENERLELIDKNANYILGPDLTLDGRDLRVSCAQFGRSPEPFLHERVRQERELARICEP